MNSPELSQLAGHLFVIAAPSGAGKTSLVRALIEQVDGLEVCVSHTTRTRRSGEVDGTHYHFVDDSTFADMVADGAFVEHATVFDHHYGTSFASIDRVRSAGRDVILEIDWQGARSIRAAIADSISIFILPPSTAELEARLRGRGDSDGKVARRMRDAVSEMSHHDEFDYLVINDSFERALADLIAVVTAARLRGTYQREHRRALLGELVAR